MLDALGPAADAFPPRLPAGQTWPEALAAAAEAAERGAAYRRHDPRRGRSSYLGQRVIGLPDPGAEAVGIWLQGAGEGIATRRAC